MFYNVAMDVQFGKLTPKGNSNIFANSQAGFTGDNFFVPSKKTPELPAKQVSTGVRINDFDSKILENNAYQEIPDDMFKIEHKIQMLESILIKINSEVSTLKSLGAAVQISDLLERKRKIEEELAELNIKYEQLGLSAKISGQIASAVSKKHLVKESSFARVKKFLSKNVLARLSKKFGHKETMKEALDDLFNINSSVDELINMTTPYGETVERYEKLTAYLNKANVIQSQIARSIENMSKNIA